MSASPRPDNPTPAPLAATVAKAGAAFWVVAVEEKIEKGG